MQQTQVSQFSWTIEFTESQDFVKIVAEGAFSTTEHSQLLEDLLTRRSWIPGMNILFDDRKVEFDGTNVELIRRVGDNFQLYDEKIGDGKIAILMKSLTDYARGRQFELITEKKISGDLKIFMDEEKAVEWLNCIK